MPSTRELHPAFRPYVDHLIDVARRAGLQPVLTSARRSTAKQAKLYQQYLAGRMPYTVLPPGRSVHEYGLAADIWCTNMPALGAYARQLGIHWAGETDPVHYGAVRSVDDLLRGQ